MFQRRRVNSAWMKVAPCVTENASGSAPTRCVNVAGRPRLVGRNVGERERAERIPQLPLIVAVPGEQRSDSKSVWPRLQREHRIGDHTAIAVLAVSGRATRTKRVLDDDRGRNRVGDHAPVA